MTRERTATSVPPVPTEVRARRRSKEPGKAGRTGRQLRGEDDLLHRAGRVRTNWLNETRADAIRALPQTSERSISGLLDLVCAGNIGNMRNLVELCEYLRRSDLDVRLSVHGSGPGAVALNEWCAPHQDPRFRFGPFQDEETLVKHPNECDMF